MSGGGGGLQYLTNFPSFPNGPSPPSGTFSLQSGSSPIMRTSSEISSPSSPPSSSSSSIMPHQASSPSSSDPQEVPQERPKKLARKKKTKSVDEKVERKLKKQNCICKWDGCNQAFDGAAELRDHLEEHIGRGLSVYYCKWEGCTFGERKKRDHMKSHIRKHHQFVGFYCPLCNEGFVRDQELRKHICPLQSSQSEDGTENFNSHNAFQGPIQTQGNSLPFHNFDPNCATGYRQPSPNQFNNGSFNREQQQLFRTVPQTHPFLASQQQQQQQQPTFQTGYNGGYSGSQYHPGSNSKNGPYLSPQPQNGNWTNRAYDGSNYSGQPELGISSPEYDSDSPQVVPGFRGGNTMPHQIQNPKRGREEELDLNKWLASLASNDIQPEFSENFVLGMSGLMSKLEEEPNSLEHLAPTIAQCYPFLKRMKQTIEDTQIPPEQDLGEFFGLGYDNFQPQQDDFAVSGPEFVPPWGEEHVVSSKLVNSAPVSYSSRVAGFKNRGQEDDDDNEDDEEEEDDQETEEVEDSSDYVTESEDEEEPRKDEQVVSMMDSLSLNGKAPPRQTKPKARGKLVLKDLLDTLDTLILLGES